MSAPHNAVKMLRFDIIDSPRRFSQTWDLIAYSRDASPSLELAVSKAAQTFSGGLRLGVRTA